MMQKLLKNINGFFILLLLFNCGCAKEYSYEGGGNVSISTDTISTPPSNFWICPACIGNDNQIESRWSFHNDNLLLCGIIDTAIVSPERTGFTFFGPSSCSADTGMVISVILESTVLNQDLYNIRSEKGAFYYYDHVGNTYIFMSRHTLPFTVTIDSYIHQTHMATGTFSGPVFKTNGSSIYITSGKFKIRL